MVYRSTEAFPKHELYGLAQQMRRAAVSIASNIAKEKAAGLTRNSGNFWFMQEGRCWSWKRS